MRISLRPAVSVFAASILISGCVGPGIAVTQEMELVESATPCCKDLTQISYAPLALQPELPIGIDRGDPVFDFGADGPGRFKAFELPDGIQDKVVEIRSLPLIDSSPAAHTSEGVYFVPVAMLLDRDKREITRIKDAQFIQSKLFSEGMYRVGDAVLQIDMREFPGAHYMIIYSGHREVMQGVSGRYYDPGVTVPAGGAFVTMGSRNDNISWRGSPIVPAGRLLVRIATP